MLNIGLIRMNILNTGCNVEQMKDVCMYIEEFILDDLHYLMYKLELRYCMENTQAFIQLQQRRRNVRIALR